MLIYSNVFYVSIECIMSPLTKTYLSRNYIDIVLIWLTKNRQVWKACRFNHHVIRSMWRYGVINLLRKHYGQLLLPAELSWIETYQDWTRFLDGLYQGYWHIHLAKKTKCVRKTANYLGRYLKKPPI